VSSVHKASFRRASPRDCGRCAGGGQERNRHATTLGEIGLQGDGVVRFLTAEISRLREPS
jgi:hypothetical protein